MFPIPGALAAYGLVLLSTLGGIVGALAGFLAAHAFKLRATAIWKNGIIGATAFIATFFVCLLIPYRNTISYKLDGGVTVTSTMDHYQHPLELGLILAGFIPILFELDRFRRSRRSGPSS